MACRLHERGGLPGAAIQGLLARASANSGGSFLHQQQGDFIGPFSITPVWGSSLGALGPDTALRLSPTLGPVSHPLLRPFTLGFDRLDDFKLLRALRRLNLSTWADLTTRSRDGTRQWLDLATLLPAVTLPSSIMSLLGVDRNACTVAGWSEVCPSFMAHVAQPVKKTSSVSSASSSSSSKSCSAPFCCISSSSSSSKVMSRASASLITFCLRADLLLGGFDPFSDC